MSTNQSSEVPDVWAPSKTLKAYLDRVADRYEQFSFIDADPICIPHAFENPRDQEIMGLFAALLAWGRRDVLIRKLEDLCARMDFRPYQFVRDFRRGPGSDQLKGFGHRTFLEEDAVEMVYRIQHAIKTHHSLEAVCKNAITDENEHIGPAIEALSSSLLCTPDVAPVRLRKHLARPSAGSACKRLSMFFRWMVRPGPVDLGIWTTIRTDQLVLPLDVHSGRQARAVGLLVRKSDDWKAALELTRNCKKLDAHDPCRYDFALFGTGAAGETLENPKPDPIN